MNCPHCGAVTLQKKGTTLLSDGRRLQRFKCTSCLKYFNESVFSNTSRFAPDKILKGDRFVITSAQNNTPVNKEFLQALKIYCSANKAKLLIIPTLYMRNLYDDENLAWEIEDDNFLDVKATLNDEVNILSDINIMATAENPLGGLDSLSKGKSLIIPHNQMQMRSLPVQRDSCAAILHTTGTITYPNYQQTKAGEKAVFNHSFAALVVEFNERGHYFIRVLNCDDDNGFYDLDYYYSPTGRTKSKYVEALIVGDEHVFVQDPTVAHMTFTHKDSIVKRLKPKKIVRHDVIDSFTVSHHHRKDSFLQYSKFINRMNDFEKEIEQTLRFIMDTTPTNAESIIISSNHHDHVRRWLTEADPKIEPWNAKIFHLLSWLMLEEIEKHGGKIHVPDAFELYANYRYPGKMKFVGRNTNYKIHGIELSNHGDVGANGSRGSLTQFSRFTEKVVIGHYHTPGINKGAYAVGTSTPKDLEYTSGPSSWMNTHCVIYPNGRRQLITITKGKWHN